MSQSSTNIEKLSEERCWQLLEHKTLGRLAVSINNEPDVFPVNFKTDSEPAVFIRTAAGLKLAAAILGSTVAFEVDAIDEESRTGWSVVIKGKASEVYTTEDRLHVEDLEVEPWVGGPKNRAIKISAISITGREIPGPTFED